MTDPVATQRLLTKLRQQGGVTDPDTLWGCWAEKRIYTGSLFPAFANCAKHRRPGYLTCRYHHDRETAAQILKGHTNEK